MQATKTGRRVRVVPACTCGHELQDHWVQPRIGELESGSESQRIELERPCGRCECADYARPSQRRDPC